MNKERLRKLIADLEKLYREHKERARELSSAKTPAEKHWYSWHLGQAAAYENMLITLSAIDTTSN